MSSLRDPSNETTIEVLRAAKEYLFAHGWHQGGFYGGDGTVCGLGACAAVTGLKFSSPMSLNLGSDASQFDDAEAALSDEVGGYFAPFNDEPGRTFDEVIDAFDLTIKRLEQPS